MTKGDRPTSPSPRTLNTIRRGMGKVNTLAHRALAAIDGASEDCVSAVAALREAPKERAEITVTVLLFASYHFKAGVRVAAARAMAAHPYGVLRDRLKEMDGDPHLTVREAAKQALDEMHNVRPPCMQCGSDGYDMTAAVRLPAPTDPCAEVTFWPVFCDVGCAVVYAQTAVQEDLDANRVHECLAQGAFEKGPASECLACDEADLVGRGIPR